MNPRTQQIKNTGLRSRNLGGRQKWASYDVAELKSAYPYAFALMGKSKASIAHMVLVD